jgi:DNA topoisomerase I
MQNSAHTLRPPSSKVLRKFGLHYVRTEELTIERRRRGSGFVYLDVRGKMLRDDRTVYRLKRLAVPPAYEAVRFAPDPHAHLQAVGRDAAGRAQYRYHPDWEKVRELRKARRLARLTEVLPLIRRWVTLHLNETEPTRDRAIAAMVELVGLTALRPGSESYARQHGTRGAATLLKSDLTIAKDRVALQFTGKGGKKINKILASARLANALRRLSMLPGKRMFQYRNGGGEIVPLGRRDVNSALQEITGRKVSLKDFRTLNASAQAVQHLASLAPKATQRARKRQLLAAMREISAELANTPTVCRKSYVHAAVVEAFETGDLQKMAKRAGNLRPAAAREKMLAKLLEHIAIRV